ncbi:hypothetical protein ACFMQL_35265 [Nonomuraea fastidiosa]|uniref:hypothetical protein n=1 Tax=Nonomuraea fastidiosa TaxID=46173 RepID=UPI00366CEF1C
MSAGRAWRALVGVGLALVVVAGCGVRPSDVIPVGPPPSGPVASARATAIYLIKDGRLHPVPRPRGRLYPADALALLAAGPTAQERQQGYTSDVPREAEPFTVASEQGGRLVIIPSGPPGELPERAVGQIVCTVAAMLPGAAQDITVAGAEPRVDPGDCPPV